MRGVCFLCASNSGYGALCTLCYACHFTCFSKGCNFTCASHEVSFDIGFPGHMFFHMLPINYVLDTFSKKRNFYTLVVSAVMCVVSLVSLCYVALCCIASHRAPALYVSLSSF